MLSWDSDSDNEPAHQPLKKAKIIGYGCIQATTSLGQSVELPRKQSAALHSRTSNIKSHQLYQAARTDLEKHLLPEITDNTPASDDASNGSLWVTKYQPKSFTDLVGDQRLFRNILSWVKNWDFAVFKRPVKSRYVPFYQMGQGFVSKYKDALDRPEKRIVLLAGPPGIGKTTLVHVIAQHCGYSILEINASDDRTSESIKGKLASLESTRIDDKRPVLLLIDEIDGAHANQDAFISIIIKTSLTCKRPIICVCNDPYVPALKLLRPACHVFHVKPLEYKILADRLIDICEWEELCEESGGDLRACLNNLQFRGRGSEKYSSKKDVAQGWLSVCKSIFDQNCSNAYLAEIMQANGDHERIVNAMFECYLSKPTARAPDSAASLGFMDQLNSKINQNQYELLRYLEFSILLFRTPIRKVEIGFPKADWICRQNMVKREQLITALTTMAKTTDTDFVTVELLPLMQHLICPTNDMDEPRINHVASLCSSLGVKYVLEKLPTGWRYLAEPFSMLCLPFSNASKIASAIESKKSKAVSPTMEEPIKKIVKGKVAKKSDSLKVNPKDFFGRDLQLEDSAQQQVVFKYKEGYLNAVRKPISMSDLFIKIVQRHSHTP